MQARRLRQVFCSRARVLLQILHAVIKASYVSLQQGFPQVHTQRSFVMQEMLLCTKGHGTVNPTIKQQQHLPMPSRKLMCSNLVQPGRLHADWLLQELAKAKAATHVQRSFTHLSPVSLHAKLQSQPSDRAQNNDKLFKYLLFDCFALLFSLVTSKAREKPLHA